MVILWFVIDKLNITVIDKNVKRSRISIVIFQFGIFEMWFFINKMMVFISIMSSILGCVIKYLRSHRSILEMVSRNLRRSDDFRVWQKVSARKQSPWPTSSIIITRKTRWIICIDNWVSAKIKIYVRISYGHSKTMTNVTNKRTDLDVNSPSGNIWWCKQQMMSFPSLNFNILASSIRLKMTVFCGNIW